MFEPFVVHLNLHLICSNRIVVHVKEVITATSAQHHLAGVDKDVGGSSPFYYIAKMATIEGAKCRAFHT